jgi:hypothetical protein
LFAGMPECTGTLWIVASMPWAWRAPVCSWIALARCHPAPESRSVVRLMSACKSLNNATVVSACGCSPTALATVFRSATRIAQMSPSNTPFGPVPRSLWKTIERFLSKHNAAALTLPSSIRDASVQHIQVLDPALLSLLVAQSLVAHFAAASSSSIVVLTTGLSPGSGQHIASALLARSCSLTATRTTGAPRVGQS